MVNFLKPNVNTPPRPSPLNPSKSLQATRNQSFLSFNANTQPKRIDALIANRNINNSVAKQVESGTLNYRIEIRYIDGTISQVPVSIEISDRPRIPEEPEDNSSFSIGNKTVLRSTFTVPTSAVATIASEINSTPMPKRSTTKIGFNR